MAGNRDKVALRASRILAASTIRQVMAGRVPDYVDMYLRDIAKDSHLYGLGATRSYAIEALSSYLEKHYRNEFCYKSLIARKLFLPRHDPADATLLTEYSIGSSCIDALVANGSLTGYEIKTEQDSASKLNKQLTDYYRAVPVVWVVASSRQEEKYMNLLDSSPAGLLLLTESLTFRPAKRAAPYTKMLNVEVMMKALRKPEYSAIVERHFGHVPGGRPVEHFSRCLELTQSIEPVRYNRYFRGVLRERSQPNLERLKLLPCRSLAHLLLQTNPTERQFARTLSWLEGVIQ